MKKYLHILLTYHSLKANQRESVTCGERRRNKAKVRDKKNPNPLQRELAAFIFNPAIWYLQKKKKKKTTQWVPLQKILLLHAFIL